MSRWKLVDSHIEFDGVAIMSTEWPFIFGSFTPEGVVELLNEVTVSGISPVRSEYIEDEEPFGPDWVARKVDENERGLRRG